jgi:hypothetical protein
MLFAAVVEPGDRLDNERRVVSTENEMETYLKACFRLFRNPERENAISCVQILLKWIFGYMLCSLVSSSASVVTGLTWHNNSSRPTVSSYCSTWWPSTSP